MKHRIYFSVCGKGFGHSSRDMAIKQMNGAKSAADIIIELSERIQCYGGSDDT